MTVNFTPCYSADSAKRYYRGADYYDQEMVGQWFGHLADTLGLKGEVDMASFDRLCENRRPDGSRLTPKTVEGRMVGMDITFRSVISEQLTGIARQVRGMTEEQFKKEAPALIKSGETRILESVPDNHAKLREVWPDSKRIFHFDKEPMLQLGPQQHLGDDQKHRDLGHDEPDLER
ncbi:Relaxase domain-containing protein [Sulfidibacter corallicola]|uniref:Relaxase domain-containing protein n=1 Tax=Sulfidibacter corallicola TaxID=2818388 RepID=A0A8A4TP20_SULCO|nr:relaxase domain-containing protein [Sulfidibacter corallicola]QTD50708.1 relaxase domain-containing protein [Sulfidibacter corallicola]